MDFIRARVSRCQKKHSPTHTYRGHQSSLICFLHLLWSMASSLFNLRAWQFFSTISLQVFFGLPLHLAPSTSYSIHFFTQSLSSFRNTCPYHRTLFRCSAESMSSNPGLPLNPLLGILSCSFMPHIHLTIHISARWSATSFQSVAINSGYKLQFFYIYLHMTQPMPLPLTIKIGFTFLVLPF